MNQTERLLAALRRQPMDRPPVVCPGGMMSVATVEAMDQCGCYWPEAHHDLDQMVRLALAVYDEGGLENLAVPFCMTVEAEALGAEVGFGDRLTQPRVIREPFATSADLLAADLSPIAQSPRAQIVLQAMRQLRAARPNAPLLGNLVGPVSLAASLVQPDRFFKEMIRDPLAVREVLERVTDLLLAFGREQTGTDVMVIADPTATGEIVGPRLFEQLVLPPLSGLIRALREAGPPVILHVCGNLLTLAPLLARLGADCLSVDAVVNLRRLRQHLPDLPLMGNIDALALEAGPPERIARWTRETGLPAADIIAPACAVVPTTPLAHLRTLAQAAQDGAEK